MKYFLPLFFSISILFGQENPRSFDKKVNSVLFTIFPRFDPAIDNAFTNISFKEISPTVRVLLPYKIKVRWGFKEELQISETQYLTNYFEQKLKTLFSNENRFLFISTQDLKTVKFNITDSSLQVKNTLSDEELVNYAHNKNADAIFSADVLISQYQIIFFISITDLKGMTLWTKEVKANYRPYEYDPTEDLAAENALRRKTGLTENYITFGFFISNAYKKTIVDETVPTGYYTFGYRFNEMATIIDFLKFYIDTKAVGSTKIDAMGIFVQPGFSFELIGNETIGPNLLMVDIGGGANISLKNHITGMFSLGLSTRLSRKIGFTGYYGYVGIKDNNVADIGGSHYGININIIF